MRRVERLSFLFCLLLCLVVVLSACGQAVVEPGSGMDDLQPEGLGEAVGEEEPKHVTALNAENMDISNMDDVTAAVVAPLGNGVLQYSWAEASGIKANDLIGICARENLLHRNAEGFDPSAAQVEQVMQKYFDVPVEHMRTASRYSSKLQTYGMYYRKEETDVCFRAISATQQGSRIVIEVGLTVPDPGETPDKQTTLLAQYAAVNYQPYGQGMLIFPSGTLTVEVGEDNAVRYLSYQFNEQFQRETEKLALYRKYVEAFKYPVGRESWNDPMQIEPDAFVVYYIYLCGTGEVERRLDVPIEEEYGSPYMPQEDLEKAVMSHFDVTPEHIRKSEYYDKEKGFYWSGGIGTLVDMEIVGARWEGNRLTLTLKSCIISSESTWRWNNEVVLEVDGESYKYISYTREQVEGE